ncbi:MAG: IpaD/SipD/SspD family type III secretion system needle tip protein [Arsenophonus endosymbiont of Dermacentor nuttalli]
MEIYKSFLDKTPIFYKNNANDDNSDINSSQISHKKTIIDNFNIQLNELKKQRRNNEELVHKNKKLIQEIERLKSSEKLVPQAEMINNSERLLAYSDSLLGGQQIENQAITPILDYLDYDGDNREEIALKFRKIRSVIDSYQKENIPTSSDSLLDDASLSKVKSSREIADSLFKSIDNINKDYLQVFQHSAKFYADLLKELNEKLASFKDVIKTDKDTIEFKFVETKELIDKLAALKKKYDNKRLVPAKGNLKNNDEAVAWAKQLGLNEEKSIANKNNNIYIKMDLSFIDEIIDHFPKISPGKNAKRFLSDAKYNSARWVAWQSSFDQFKTEAQTTSQTVIQKYSNANAIYDNVIKILSNTIRELLESNKSFLII